MVNLSIEQSIAPSIDIDIDIDIDKDIVIDIDIDIAHLCSSTGPQLRTLYPNTSHINLRLNTIQTIQCSVSISLLSYDALSKQKLTNM